MSEENTIEEGDFAKLKKAHASEVAELKAQLDALRPSAINETIRSVGLDPNEGNGLVLKDLLGDSPDAEKAQELVAKYGWEPPEPAPQLSAQEQAARQMAERQGLLNSVTSSDDPSRTIDDEISELQAALAAARASRNWDEAKAIGQQLMQANNQKMFTSVMSHQ